MNNHLLYLVFLSLLFLSCQPSINLPAPTIDAPITVTSTNTASPKDPLFFIEGQLCQHVRKIFQDKQGNLWFGTNIYGLMQYNGDSLIYFKEELGRITGIAEDNKGNIWLGTYFGLVQYNGQTFTNVTKEHNFPNTNIWSLHIDKKGKIWTGTINGVYVFDGEKAERFELPKPVIKAPQKIYGENRITSIVEDQQGNLWFGTDGFGICKYDGHAFIHFTTENGLPNNNISQLLIDSKNNLWIGTYLGGLSRYDGTTFSNFTKDGTIQGVEVGGFFEDEDGTIWFAVENNGVYHYKNGQFTNFNKEDGLLTNAILSIYRDRENRFWFGGWGGLFRYDKKQFLPITKKGPWSE